MTYEQGVDIKRIIMAKGYGVAGRIRSIMRSIEREGRAEWGSIFHGDVDFAIAQYGRRGWDESFKSKLQKKASDFAASSTYITVYKKLSNGDRGSRAGNSSTYPRTLWATSRRRHKNWRSFER